MPVTFRLATKEDLPQLVRTYNDSIPSRRVTADLEPVTVESKIDWFKSHQNNKRPLLVVECEGVYCGWMSFSSFYGRPAYDHTVELSIYLDIEFQGRGIGNYCMIKADQLARELHIKTLLGFIFGHNESSLKLFYRHGYEKWAQLPQIADMGDTKRDLLILGKKIH